MPVSSGALQAPGSWPPGTFIGGLKPADLAAFSDRGHRRVFLPGESLIIEGDSSKDVFLLLNGWVKVIGNSPDGRQVLLSVRTGGDSVGELAALDGQARSATVVAVTRVTTCAIPQDEFLAVIGASASAALAVARASAAKMRLATRHRIDASGASALRRLARVLAYLAEAYATPSSEGLRIDVVLTRAELAALVGVAEPSLYRAMARMRADGVLTLQDRHYVVCDSTELEKIASGENQEDA